MKEERNSQSLGFCGVATIAVAIGAVAVGENKPIRHGGDCRASLDQRLGSLGKKSRNTAISSLAPLKSRAMRE
jgi:hypothetical protein